MKKLPIVCIMYTFVLLHCGAAFGKHFEISHPYAEKQNSGFQKVIPQKLIIDQDGNVFYNEVGYRADIVRKIKKTPPLKESAEILETLKTWMPPEYDFSDASYTIVLVITDRGCPPCERDEMLLTKIHDTLTDKNINIVTINFMFDPDHKVTVNYTG